MSMKLSEELKWRGFINQTTFRDIKDLDKQKWIFYHGFDASAPSQTIGNLASMMMDLVLMRHGHQAIILAGGATSLIGDPGGKNTERMLQDEKTVAHNVAKAKEQIKSIFKGHDFSLVNNLDWYRNLSLLEFLRDVGKHFSMTPLVQRDYIATRMGESGAGISYTEFSYTLLQGYDYLKLHKDKGVNLQLAGSDQWGNGLSGVELIRRVTGKEVHVLTCPLIINKSTGKKFGKSEEGAVWLDPAMTSPYKFYQFWINLDDEGVEDYLKIYTQLGKDEIDEVMQTASQKPKQRIAQEVLAFEVTKLVHGQQHARRVHNITHAVFRENFSLLTDTDLDEIKTEIPVIKGKTHEELVKIMVDSKLASSNTEARRFITERAIYINGQQITIDKSRLDDKDFHGKYCLIRRGKNQLALVERQ